MAYNYFEKTPVESVPAIEKEKQNATLNDGLAGDAVDSFQAGALSGMGGIFDFVGAEGVAKSLYDWSDEQQKTMSESGRESLNKQFITEDANGDIAIGEGMKDIDTWILTMANVAGQFASTAVPGGGAARAVTKVASLGKKGSKAADAIGMGATGGAAGTGQGMEQARQEIQNMPDDVLADSPMFVDVLRDIHSKNPSLSGAEKWDLAKDEIARRVAQDVRTDPKVLVTNFAASAIGDPVIGKALTGARIAKNGALGSALKGFATEGATESLQAGVQQYGINEAIQPIDNRDPMKGVVAAGLNEGLAGGAFGGLAGGAGGIVNKSQDNNNKPKNEKLDSYQKQSAEVLKSGYADMVNSGMDEAEAKEAIREQQYNAAIKKGFTEEEANVAVARTMRDMFAEYSDIADIEPEQAIPDDNVTPQFQQDDALQHDQGVDYDSPTAARKAGFAETDKAAGQFGDMLTSPAQESLRALNQGNGAPSVDERVKAAAFDKSPTPDDRFSPIKYTHEGELLGPEQQAQAPGVEKGPIDGFTVPEQGKLPTTEQTKNRQMREQAQAEIDAQAKGIEQKDIIFGEDGRPQQRAQEQIKQAGKDAENLLPHKDIVFAGDQSGVNVARNGLPFKTKRDALLSKEARAARRAGQKTKAIPFDNGFGWTTKDSSFKSAPNTGPDLSVENQQTDATLTNEGSMPQQSESIEKANEKPAANLAQPKGKRSTTFTPTGKQIETEFAIFDANDQSLVTSNDSAGNSNPNYPQHLQPRDRTRVSSLAQISEIANKIEPSRLGDSQETDRGAPIVKSGNGRVLAIRQAYKNGKAEKYKQFLIDNAEQFGLNKQDIEAMEAPILTRERLTELSQDELVNFTVDSNRQAGIERSPTELALTDASLFTDDELKLLNVPENGNILSSDNKAFLNSFANKLGNNEAAKYRQSDGTWNSQFAARVNNAIFAKAYDSPDLLSASSEATTKESANLINALVNGASKVAALKGPADGVSVGNAFGQELAETVSSAANMIIKSRRDNLSIDDMISQQDAFTDRDEEAEALAKLLSKNIRSAKKMSAIINSIADDIDAALINAEQADIFTGETQPLPSMSEVLSNAQQRFTQDKQDTSRNMGGRSATEAQQSSQTQGMASDASQGSRSGGENAGVTSSKPESADQGGGPDMFGDSESPLFDQEPNVVNFKDLKTVKERVEAFANLQENDTVIDHRGNKIGTVFAKPRKNSRAVRIQKGPGDTDTFNVAALAGGGADTVSALDNYNSNQATVKQPSSKPKPETKQKPESKLDAAEEKLNDELQDLFGELKEAFNEQKGRLNSGIDPKIAFIVSKIGAVLAAKGIVKFAKWAKQLTKLAKANGIEQNQLKPYLKSAYASISADPVRYNVTDEVADTMDAPREIRALDVDAILSEEVSTNESKAEEATNESTENKPSLYIDAYKSSFIVKGDTKPHKDELGKKGLGGIWHRQQQGWMFPPSRRGEVEAWIKSVTGESVANESVSKDSLEGLIQDNLASINDNRALKNLVSQYHDISTGEVTDAQMKEAQEIVELALVKEAQAIVREGANPKDTYEKLVSLYKNQPNLTVRSSTSMKNQAYSTPAPLAYLSSNLAGIQEDTTVYEPTAGNGMLLIGASQDNAIVNELNDLRVKQLRAQGYKVTQKDATNFVPDEKVDSAIMNPPFGKLDQVVEYDGYKIKSIDHLIAAKALEAIDDNGKASIIIGASKEPGVIGAADRVFFNWLYSNYNVADHFEVSGDLYSRQGAGWPVRVITVNGRQESNKFSPKSGSIERVNSWDELYERYNEAMAAARRPIDRDSDTSANSGSIDTIFTPSVRGENTSSISGTNSGGRTGSGTRDTVVNDGSRGGRGNGGTKLDSNANNANGASGNNTKPSGVDQTVTNGSERVPRNDSTGTDRNDGRESVATGSNYQAPYTTQSGGSNEAVLTPVNMAEASKNSLRAIEGAVGTIDNYVMDKLGYKTKDELYNSFMGLQIDTVAAAIYNAEKKNKGIIIADQTGVGKGRQAAGIIRYAMRSGKTPIFITVKDNLFTDMYDDLLDIGTDNAAPLIVNQDAFIKSGDQKIFKTQSRAKHVALIDEIINTGKLPDDNNMLFITYSQLDGNRQRALIEALKDNAYFVMDEAHNAAGERVKKTKGRTRTTRAGFLYGAIENSPVAYLSATYAKRPDNLPVFYRTDLMDSVDKPEDLIEAASAGGEALQTIIAGMLAETGQLYRRERSFEGIEIKTTLDETNKAKHADISDKVTTGLRAIVSADKAFHDLSVDAINQKLQEEGMSASGAGNKADASFNHTNFTSIGHNFISQLLMGLKVDTVADRAIEMHKANQKPVIALQNTMGSFLSEFVADNGLEPGDVIDADYRDVMLRALERTRRVSVKDKSGDSKSVDVPLSYLDPYVQSLYHEAESIINNLDISDMPISPIDYVRNKLENAGIKTSEITGRKYRIDYSSGEPVLDVITTAEQKDKRGTVDKFNNGELDSLVLNVAGSTGLSIHAAEKFSDTRKRAMIVMQPMADINILMQMLGRINRTGQVEKPFYEFPTLSIPAEKRPAAKTSQKLKSLNANTSANTDSDVSLNSVDMMNKYGDKVMTEYLKDNGSVASSLGIPQPASEGAIPGLYEKATGRMALLPVSKQEAIYADIEAEYKDLIDYLDSTGQNDLSPQMLDLDARIIDSKVIYEGKNPETIFGGNTFLHQVDAKYQGKPPTADEVIKAIAKAGDPAKLKDKIISSKSGDTKYINDIESKLSTARAELEKAKLNDKDAVPDLEVRVMGLESQAQTFAEQKRAMELALNEYQVGSHFAIQLPEEKVNAVVVGIKDSHKKGKGNPYTPGKLKISLMLNSGSRQISLPLSQLKGDEIHAYKISKGSEQEIRNEFKFDPLRDTERREVRYIATGNLIMGSKEVKGRIATFTDKEGKTHQGILLPKNYEGKEFSAAGSSKTFSMRDGDTLAKFLNAARAKLEGSGLLDTTKSVSIKPVGENDWSITIPKANKLSIVKSVKFDQDLIDAMGTDFYGSSASMTARFNKRRLKAVVNQLTKLVTIQGQGSYRDDWVKAGGNAEPKAPKSFSQDIKFSKSNTKGKAKGVNAEQAQKIADGFIENLNGANGIKVRILATTAEAEQMWRMSLDGATVKGAYSEISNTVYVIAENIDSVTDLKQTLAHETIAHGGLDTVIGKEAKQEFINRIKKTKGRKAFEKYWKDANTDYWDMSDDVKAEEIFARFVENEPSKGELKYWWQALKRWIKAQLDKAGIMYREDDEVTAMRDMLESIVKGFKAQREPKIQQRSGLAYSQPGKKFSRTAEEDTRTAKEKLGLVEQAKESVADIIKGKLNSVYETAKDSSFWNRLNEGIFDGLAGIKQAEEKAGITDINKQGYVSARLASGLADVLHGVYNYGAPQWKNGIVARKENTKGLLEVFGMLGDDLNNWLAWMGAHRAEKLKEDGRENNLTDADIAELKALGKGKEKLFEEVRKEYNKVNSAILDLAEQAGLLNKQQRAAFDEEYYVPFFRDMGETDPEMDDIKRAIIEPHTRNGIAGQSAQIKALKGGGMSTKDLLENIITRQSTLIDASLKNKAMLEVVNNLDGTDFMKSENGEDIAALSQHDLNKLGKVKVMNGGKAQAYVVSDPALLRSLIQINSNGSQNLFRKLGRSAKRFLTAGVTLSPDFIFRNFVRDAAHAWMINKDDFKLGTDSFKGLKKAFKEDEAYRDLIFSGAAFQGGYVHGSDPEAGAQQMRRALRSKGLSNNQVDSYMRSIVDSGASLLEKYRNVSDKFENANRLSTYEAALKAGKSKRQAAFEAKDLMDYSLKGNFETIAFFVDMLPFFNARLQGMSKLVRASKANGDDQLLRILSANLAGKGIKLAAFSLALAAMNDDDERYQELPDWDKDMNWHVFAGEDHYRIPKPFELGVIFGTMPERLFHFGTGTQNEKDLGRAVVHAITSTMSMNPIPQFMLPATEVVMNKSFFKWAPIEGMADQNKQAEDRYSAYTSDTAKAIAQAFGVSPKKVEHLIKGYTGTLGAYVLGASDIVARQAMGIESAETPVSRYPVIKSFYQGSGPKSSTKFANEFYEALDTANQAYGSYKRAQELGDTSRIKELIENDGEKLRSRAKLAKIQRGISKLNKMQKAVNDNNNLSSSQKREQLDNIQRKKNAIFHKAYIAYSLGEW
ncbi:LPD38 domain-containing protein [Parasphingorhabdus sp.]|uniref:LPD38 domain-containing protein n=1 Tax=Parasphingorhabdus sp. TaxID=2709688 RepID=UPI003A94B02B